MRDVRVTVPLAVRRGDNAQLICKYDLENDTLYSVKWYKGLREFYRYLPKENPAMKLFNVAGIAVDVSSAHIYILFKTHHLGRIHSFLIEMTVVVKH